MGLLSEGGRIGQWALKREREEGKTAQAAIEPLGCCISLFFFFSPTQCVVQSPPLLDPHVRLRQVVDEHRCAFLHREDGVFCDLCVHGKDAFGEAVDHGFGEGEVLGVTMLAGVVFVDLKGDGRVEDRVGGFG